MTTRELAKLLLESPDREVYVSIDVSTCDEDAGARAFSTKVYGTVITDSEVALCMDGYLNGDAVIGWKMIETAPKDGTNIIAWPCLSGEGAIQQVSWKIMKIKSRWEMACGRKVPCSITHWHPMPKLPRRKNDKTILV